MMLVLVYLQVPPGVTLAPVPSLAVSSDSYSEPGSSSSPELSLPDVAAEEATGSLPEQDRLVEVFENAGVWVQFGEGLWARATRLKLLDDR